MMAQSIIALDPRVRECEKQLISAACTAILSVTCAAGTARSQAIANAQATPPQSSTTQNQATPAASGAIEEIIVTAQRREETVQKSSLAIEAFNPETLRSVGLTQAADLTKLVQGLQIGFSGSTSQIYIRGVGDFSANSLANPGVAFNVDGVNVGRPEGVGVNFYDIARVEVVKGPQGTLYGRNASGGAINLITNSPTLDAVRGDLNLDVGNYSLYHVDGAINVPLSSTVAMRVAVNRIKRDGYLTDGTSDDDQLAARAKLLFEPSDATSVLLSVDGAQVRGKGGGYVYLPRRPGSSAWEGSTSPAANAYVATFNPLIVRGGSDAYVHNNFWDAGAQLDQNVNFANLTVIAGYRHTDTDTLSYNAQSQHLLGKSNQETVEARLGNSTANLKWVAGLYYFHEADPGEIRVFVGPGLLKTRPTYNPSGTSYAAFGETTFSVTDAFRLIAGTRYTTEKRQLSGNFFVYPTQGTNFIDLESFDGKKTFNSVTWKAGTEFDLTAQNMLFFTAGTGFKAGGITQTVSPQNVYQPEKILAFELGSRNRFFDNKLQANIEAFHWTYKDQQNSHLTFDTLGNFNFLTQNAGQARLYGLNIEVIAKPTNADTLHLAAEYDHSKYTNFSYQVPFFTYSPVATGCRNGGTGPGPFVPLTTIDCSGFQLPHAPEWAGEADYMHSFGLPSGAAIDFNVGGRFASQTWLGVDFTPSEKAPSFAILNASLTYRSPQRNYSVDAYVRNLNNGVEYTGGQLEAFAPPLVSANISAPRTFGVQLHLTW
jgi:iron complex outermembrane receptor protein